MTREEAIERFNGIINAMSISIAQSKFYPSKAELDELCDMAIEALQTIDNCDQCEWCCPSDGIPTIHVVRCKDCKHWASAEDYDCEIHSGAWGAEDFCSYGERKEP